MRISRRKFSVIVLIEMDFSRGRNLVFWFTLAYLGLTKAVDYEYTLERLEAIPGDKENLVDFSNCRVVRKAKDYVLTGNITYKVDLDDNYMLSVTISNSPLGNNQYRLSPFNPPLISICDFLNTTYKKYVQPNLVDKSNFPIVPPEGLCPLPKGIYYVKDVEPYADFFPDHLPEGLWKVELKYMLYDDSVGGVRILGRINRKFF